REFFRCRVVPLREQRNSKYRRALDHAWSKPPRNRIRRDLEFCSVILPGARTPSSALCGPEYCAGEGARAPNLLKFDVDDLPTEGAQHLLHGGILSDGVARFLFRRF